MIWETTITALLTLAIYSFLAGDNPVYRFAEHLLVGLSVGYTLVLTTKSVILPQAIQPLAAGNWMPVVSLSLGVLMLMRLARRMAPWSRIPMALVVGGGAGLAIPAMLQARVLTQIAATISGLGTWNGWIIMTGVAATLTYFVFSRRQSGAWGVCTRAGRYFMMAFFGATFAYTVMSRVALLIGRLEFLLADWLGIINT